MKIKLLSLPTIISIILAGCNSQLIPLSTATPANTVQVAPTLSNTNSNLPSSLESLPESVTVVGNTVTFDQWGLSVDIPLDTWAYNPTFYKLTDNFEMFSFSRMVGITEESGVVYTPFISISFYSIPEGTGLINFSRTLLTHLGNNSLTIVNTFGFKGSEPVMKIPVMGYYGHLGENNKYSVYVVHTINGTVGIQVSFEIVDSVLDQAKPEFFAIMESLRFVEEIPSAGSLTQTSSPLEESFQSMQSATSISASLIYSGVDLSRGSDGLGNGLDADGNIYTCSGLAYNLVNFQGLTDITISDASEIDSNDFSLADIVIFTDSIIPGITAHAAGITKLDSEMIYISGTYGPKKDGTYITQGYQDVPVTDFLGTIFQTMHIYHYGR